MTNKEIDMQEARDVCFDFIKNYYLEHGMFPREFEFEGVCFPLCDYLGWFSDEDIDEMKIKK